MNDFNLDNLIELDESHLRELLYRLAIEILPKSLDVADYAAFTAKILCKERFFYYSIKK